MCRYILYELTGKQFLKNRSISWLINPNTKYRLEIDCYNEELKLGIEYNDHKKKYHIKQSDEEHKSVQKRDKIKQELCKQNNILLLYVPIDYTYKDRNKMKEYIKQLLIDNNKKHLLISNN